MSADRLTAAALLAAACTLAACSGIAPAAGGPSSPAAAVAAPLPPAAPPLPLIWQGGFDRGLDGWPLLNRGWGLENRSFAGGPAGIGPVMKVYIPKGTIDPASMRRRGQRLGGTGFMLMLPGGYEEARLRYRFRLPADFQPGRGGKLPGLCGGSCNGGGNIPDGSDGFSARFVWMPDLTAVVYAYLPASVKVGTSIGRGRIPLRRDEWTLLEQELRMNTPGAADGSIRVWVDGDLVLDEQGVLFRTVPSLKISRIYFDVFYGGGDDSWAAPQDTTIEFADFAVHGR